MRTSTRDVYAAGDCTEAPHLVLGRAAWIPLGPTANKQGKVARRPTAAGADDSSVASSAAPVSNSSTRSRAHWPRWPAEIAGAGLDAVSAVSQHQHARRVRTPAINQSPRCCMPSGASGRLLGAQMIGADAVAKRIDVFATALHARMTLAQVEALDLTYAPPFAPVYDPILIAATVGVKELARLGLLR